VQRLESVKVMTFRASEMRDETLARLQRACVFSASVPDVSRLATFSPPLARLNRNFLRRGMLARPYPFIKYLDEK
jgi:hypothetical protein